MINDINYIVKITYIKEGKPSIMETIFVKNANSCREANIIAAKKYNFVMSVFGYREYKINCSSDNA